MKGNEDFLKRRGDVVVRLEVLPDRLFSVDRYVSMLEGMLCRIFT